MAEPPSKPILQKPPGYRDPNAPVQPVVVPRPPVRKPYLPPSFKPKKKRRSCCRSCCCYLCLFILILIIVLSIAGGIFYLWFNPRLPVFHLQSYRISQFNVTVKFDGTYLDAQTVVRIELKNPNGKLSVYYADTDVDASVGVDRDTSLGSKTVPAFTQGKNNITSLKVETSVKNQLVDTELGTKLKASFRSKALVVNVEAHTGVALIVQGWRIGPVGIKVLCGGVSLKSLEGGDMPKCTINMLRWINIH